MTEHDGLPAPVYRALVAAYVHPLALEVLRRAAAGETSPKQLADQLGEKLPNVSYHVGQLRAKGLLVLVRTEPRRGAVEHFYELAR